jgi:hypothetical protein
MLLRGEIERILVVTHVGGLGYQHVIPIEPNAPHFVPEEVELDGLVAPEDVDGPRPIGVEYESEDRIDPSTPAWLPARSEAELDAEERSAWARGSFERLRRWFREDDES